MFNLIFFSTLESSKSLSSSAPGAISEEQSKQKTTVNQSSNSSVASGQERKRRMSKDSAMEDENEVCRSLSGYSDSTEQSAPINFDMSNRVKWRILVALCTNGLI